VTDHGHLPTTTPWSIEPTATQPPGSPQPARSVPVTNALQQFLTEGYAVFPGVLPWSVVTAMRESLESLRTEVADAPAFALTPLTPAPDVEVSCTGLVFKRLLSRRSALAEQILAAGPAAVVREVLGSDARVEQVGGVLTDHTRPFYPWHHHVGGPDDTFLRKAGLQVAVEPKPRRLSYLLYLDAVTEQDGPLLILPTPAGQPRPAQGGITDPQWPDACAVTFPAGSVVLLDERTWHAVPQRTTPGPRRWIGMHVAAAAVPVAAHQDNALSTLGFDTVTG
jgi:hypothetical protein